jgi:hypothetical protein
MLYNLSKVTLPEVALSYLLTMAMVRNVSSPGVVDTVPMTPSFERAAHAKGFVSGALDILENSLIAWASGLCRQLRSRKADGGNGSAAFLDAAHWAVLGPPGSRHSIIPKTLSNGAGFLLCQATTSQVLNGKG